MQNRKDVPKGGEPNKLPAKFMDTRFQDAQSVALSAEEFASLGGGEVAYVKTMRSEDVQHVFPNAPQIQAGIKIYALLAADGSPILLTDNHDAVVAGAWENELATVSLH